MEWTIKPGETLLRRELHDRYGGGRFGGMEPSVLADSVFLFSKPSAGAAFGYKYDGWHGDGTFHYTGDGQVGDQREDSGGNKALLSTRQNGRAVRVFRSEGTYTTYAGQFALVEEQPPFYRTDAPDRDGVIRSVLVFRLRPVGDVADVLEHAEPDASAPVEVPVEASNIERYVAGRPDEPIEALRREAELVKRFVAWLEGQGHRVVRHKVPLPGGGYLFTDVFDATDEVLVEAKASAARASIRLGIGQVLDYSRFVQHKRKALLVPVVPAEDLLALLRSLDIATFWPEADGFRRPY